MLRSSSSNRETSIGSFGLRLALDLVRDGPSFVLAAALEVVLPVLRDVFEESVVFGFGFGFGLGSGSGSGSGGGAVVEEAAPLSR